MQSTPYIDQCLRNETSLQALSEYTFTIVETLQWTVHVNTGRVVRNRQSTGLIFIGKLVFVALIHVHPGYSGFAWWRSGYSDARNSVIRWFDRILDKYISWHRHFRVRECLSTPINSYDMDWNWGEEDEERGNLQAEQEHKTTLVGHCKYKDISFGSIKTTKAKTKCSVWG